MRKQGRPGVDGAIEPQHRMTHDGQPLSYNRAPAADLDPWIARLYASVVETPPGYRIDCGLFNDNPAIRVQLKGVWTAHTADGDMTLGRSALFFGPQTRRMPVSVTESFASVGISLRPGACHVLRGLKVEDYHDRIVSCRDFGYPEEQILERFEPDGSPEDWLNGLEAMFRTFVEMTNAKKPDPVTVRFEALSYSNPTIGVAEFAHEAGIEQRRLERIVRRDFGLSPKRVLRRARALDMASNLRGVADGEEADELALRYYDQSHLIREFVELFGMTPHQFAQTPQPILTLALGSRQSRRLETIARIAPGEPPPWELKARSVE